MSNANRNQPTASAQLALITRYHGAWLEHGTRVTQRQNTIQMYLGACGVVIGFYANSGKQSDVAPFVAFGVAFLTCVSALLIYMHLRVMQHLCDFMMRCEKYAAAEIRANGGGTDDLFYFYHPKNNEVGLFHGQQRLLHRFVLAGILGGTYASAVALTWHNIDHIAAVLVSCLVALAVGSLFIGVWLDKKDA